MPKKTAAFHRQPAFTGRANMPEFACSRRAANSAVAARKNIVLLVLRRPLVAG
jgi:hypothetical protein